MSDGALNGVYSHGARVGGHQPVLGLEDGEGLHLIVDDALEPGPLVRLQAVQANNAAFASPHNRLGLLLGLAQEQGSGDRVEQDLLESLNKSTVTILFM